MYFIRFCIIFAAFTFFFSTAYAIDAYQVDFKGDFDEETVKLLQSSSQLVSLQNSPPSTLKGLKRRAEEDMENLAHVLQSRAFYDPKITYQINSESNPIQIKILIETGPVYPLADFQFLLVNDDASALSLYEMIKLKHVGICLGKPAYPKTILEAEEALLEKLNLKGFPFAKVEKRQVIADLCLKSISVTLHVDTGPRAYFGPLTICGQKKIRSCFFDKKIAWREGDLFNPKKIEETQGNLESSGLFRTVSITPASELDEDGLLPVRIEVSEAKHRSIGFGLNYTTDLGPGLSAEWEHRNLNQEGQRLSFNFDIWKTQQQGTLRFVTPDFKRPRQDLIFLAEFGRESVEAFTESFFSLSTIIEKQLSEKSLLSYGFTYKNLRSQHSDNNRVFNLVKFPVHWRYSNANSPLDPVKGYSLNLKIIPTAEIFSPKFAYCINTFTGTCYLPLGKNQKCVLASKLMLGSIIGAGRREIPPPERLYAGSDSTLRGYSYLTVSPLDEKRDPIGGRSLAIFSLEPRFRIGENFGWVLFYDVGNVYSNALPNLKQKQLQGAGAGLRYYTPIGPLRLDVAFPLNRRHKVDSACQVYFSIGQSF